jgi:hypothetical protein
MGSISSNPFDEEHIVLVNIFFSRVFYLIHQIIATKVVIFFLVNIHKFSTKKSDFNPHKGLLKKKWPK